MKIAKALALIGLATCLAGASADAKEWKTVRFGMDATYPPFESVDPSGKIVGFEMDYANALCAKMKVTCTFQNQDWDGMIPALLSGKFDVIFSSMNMTPARAQKVLFSDMYYATAPVWVTPGGNKSDDVSPAALKGKTVGTQSSTVFANYLDKDYKGVEREAVSGRRRAVPGSGQRPHRLRRGRHPGGGEIHREEPRLLPHRQEDPAHRPTSSDPASAPPSARRTRSCAAMFNKAIAEADADGTYKTIEAKYFKIDIRGK